MPYLMMSRVFFTPVLLRAIHASFRLLVLEGECSSNHGGGIGESEVSDRAQKVAFFDRKGGFLFSEHWLF
jgi:hypothetical protein